MSDNLLPWHQSLWKRLQNRRSNHQLPHALLFTGLSGVGKLQFAKQFTQSLLCEKPNMNGDVCGLCHACQLLKAKNHPDYILIEPEETGKAIKIDQIRNLVTKAGKTSQLGGNKVIIISPADSMNVNAANALLKTLEEPGADTVIILVTERPTALPATIRSRCQILPFPAPDREQAIQWLSEYEMDRKQIPLLLNLVNGAPLKALTMIEQDELSFRQAIFKAWCGLIKGAINPVELAEQWVKLDINLIIENLLSWVSDIIKIQQSAKGVINVDIAGVLTKIADKKSSKAWFDFYDELIKANRWLRGPSNLNVQMLLEGLLVDSAKF